MEAKEVVDVLSAALTPLIAILAAYIAWQQYRIQHKSFNGQMYERRYTVFKAFMEVLSHIMREGGANYQLLGKFYAEASEADFLFSEAICNKREELYKEGIESIAARERLYPRGGGVRVQGEERGEVAGKDAERVKWFFDQINETKELFKQEMHT